jgi:subtilase family serine protease
MAVNNPSSPDYHHYMQGTQFQDLFGPSSTQQSALESYLATYGITVTVVSPFLWNVRGTAAAMDAAFDTTFVSAVASDGNHGYAPLTTMKLPSNLAAGVTVTGAFQNAAHVFHTENRLSSMGDRLRDRHSGAVSPVTQAGTIALNITNEFDTYNWPISYTATEPVIVFAPTDNNASYNLSISGGTPPYAVTWNWGDGTIQSFSTSYTSIALSHNYPFPGQTDYCFATFTVACNNITVTVTGATGSGSIVIPVVPVTSPQTDQIFYNAVTLYKQGDTGQNTKIGFDEMCDPSYPTAEYLSDINHFSAVFGLPLMTTDTLQLVGSGNTDANCLNNGNGSSGWSGETLLDMEWSHSMAPNATLVVDLSASAMQEGDAAWDTLSSGVFVDSNSWGCYYNGTYGCGYDWSPWTQAAAQGQSYLTASGDCGAAGMDGSDPPTDTSSGVGVGGTDIYPYASGVFRAEFAWNGTTDTNGCSNDEGSTGGYASNWGLSNTSAIPTPWYQKGTPGFVNPYRGVPDVSAIGGTWVAQYEANFYGWAPDAGTSLASPTFAAMLDLMYQYNGTAAHANGFANKDLYNIAKSANYNTGFHDIVVGNNIVNGGTSNEGPCPTCYNDTVGWDAVTGLGSADVGKLAELIATQNSNPSGIGPLTAVLAANVTYGPAALSVNFGADVTGGPASLTGYSYRWDFGDGTTGTSTAYQTDHIYAHPGIYHANVTVTAGADTGSSNYVTIHVTGPDYIGPTLSSVSVNPATGLVSIYGTEPFAAVPVCVGGNCPSPDITYSWSLSHALGTLNVSSGSSVAFTAGTVSGTVGLFVNATFLGFTAESGPTIITVTPNALRSLTVVPASAYVTPKGAQSFNVTPICSAGNCPSGTLFTWSVTSTLGSLNTTNGSAVTFTAGSTKGTLALFVNGSLNGVTEESQPVMITILPTLAYVVMTPLTASVDAGTMQNFTTAVYCTGGTCPSGTTYAWALTGAIGSLNATTGSTVSFTAGSLSGTTVLYVNATLNGKTVTGTASITVVGNLLQSVAVSPSSAMVALDGTRTFNVTATCSLGTCPVSVAFAWSLTSSLGALNLATGSSVTFTAGTTPGNLALFVNASLNGVVKESSPVPIELYAALESVTVSPMSASTSTGGTLTFTSTITCLVVTCPAGASYMWSYSSSLGTLNSITASTVTFTAGTNAGTGHIILNVTLDGKTVSSGLAMITVTSSSTSTSSNGSTLLILVVVVVVVAVVAVVVFFMWRRKKAPPAPQAPPPPAAYGAPPPPDYSENAIPPPPPP